ncbi:transposase [Solimicrobium silvestre]|uniref:Transposase IS200 like n=1 Tax=Solimicrobium silvestre TaxID=2099400 RepID=A0A2S9H206_9BURK|nr:transposase [Solimicrobium silvestre]PRC94021.1 Transposase IS200 like [Solimicrobium silvestre]
MARLPRLTIANHQHHIIQRGNDNRLIFCDADDVALFRQLLLEAAKKFDVAIHAYVFMPNHFHLLATPQTDDGLGRMMQWLGRHYVPYFNRRYERSGTLWQGRFKSLLIDSAAYFMLCSRYIESNPVRAGLVSAPADYVDSSYLHHIGALVDPLISDHPLYWNLGNTPFQREAVYKELLEQALTLKEIEEITKACLKGWPLGSSHFKEQLEKQASRRINPLKRGRPRLHKPKLEKQDENNPK